MQFKFRLNFIYYSLALILAGAFSGCSKKEEYRPGIPKGTNFSTINLSGYVLGDIEVHIGPKGSVAGDISEEVSFAGNVPFAASQTENRVGFFKKDGTFFTGSQINFKAGRDTSIKIFYDGKVVQKNPVFPLPAPGKQGLRITFKSTGSAYKGRVNIELHEKFTKDTVIKVVNNGTTQNTTITLIKIRPQASMIIRDVVSTEFSDFVEVPPPVSPTFSNYVFYIRVADNNRPLPYPEGVKIPLPYGELDSSPLMPDYTALITIRDVILDPTDDDPNRKLSYSVNKLI
jgi:hypothetical protein